MSRKRQEAGRSYLNISHEALQPVELGKTIATAVFDVLKSYGLLRQEGMKVMVGSSETLISGNSLAPAAPGSESVTAEAADPLAASPPPAAELSQPGGGTSTGIISEGELFDEFIDGNVSNSMIFANYTNSGNLTLTLNFYNQDGPSQVTADADKLAPSSQPADKPEPEKPPKAADD